MVRKTSKQKYLVFVQKDAKLGHDVHYLCVLKINWHYIMYYWKVLDKKAHVVF